MIKATYERKHLIWGSEGVESVAIMVESTEAGRQALEQKPRAHILVYKHEAKRANQKQHP